MAETSPISPAAAQLRAMVANMQPGVTQQSAPTSARAGQVPKAMPEPQQIAKTPAAHKFSIPDEMPDPFTAPPPGSYIDMKL